MSYVDCWVLIKLNWLFQCSATCGNGMQTREIKCLDKELKPSKSCGESTKPNKTRNCQINSCKNMTSIVGKYSSEILLNILIQFLTETYDCVRWFANQFQSLAMQIKLECLLSE